MRQYLARLFELTLAGFLAGASSYVVQNGFELSEASVRGLLVAGGFAAYGALVKRAGADTDRPTLK